MTITTRQSTISRRAARWLRQASPISTPDPKSARASGSCVRPVRRPRPRSRLWLMQAYAEGFDILKGKSSDKLPEDERFDLNLKDIAEVWRRGSVISSWLLDLTAIAMAKDPELAQFSGRVADSGEGHWTVEAAME